MILGKTNHPMEIDWIQFEQACSRMEEHLRFQQELEAKSKEGWFVKMIKFLSNLTILGGPGKSEARLRAHSSTEKLVKCPQPGELSEELYIKWLEIGSEEELNEFYVDPKTHIKLLQYEKHSRLLQQDVQAQ